MVGNSRRHLDRNLRAPETLARRRAAPNVIFTSSLPLRSLTPIPVRQAPIHTPSNFTLERSIAALHYGLHADGLVLGGSGGLDSERGAGAVKPRRLPAAGPRPYLRQSTEGSENSPCLSTARCPLS